MSTNWKTLDIHSPINQPYRFVAVSNHHAWVGGNCRLKVFATREADSPSCSSVCVKEVTLYTGGSCCGARMTSSAETLWILANERENVSSLFWFPLKTPLADKQVWCRNYRWKYNCTALAYHQKRNTLLAVVAFPAENNADDSALSTPRQTGLAEFTTEGRLMRLHFDEEIKQTLFDIHVRQHTGEVIVVGFVEMQATYVSRYDPYTHRLTELASIPSDDAWITRSFLDPYDVLHLLPEQFHLQRVQTFRVFHYDVEEETLVERRLTLSTSATPILHAEPGGLAFSHSSGRYTPAMLCKQDGCYKTTMYLF